MAASAGSIVVNLDANSVKLLRELQKAQRQTKKTGNAMQRNMVKAFKTIGRYAARIGPALAIGFTTLAAAGVKSADQLGKVAVKLGLTAEELAGLQFAAQQTGVKVEALNMGLQRMVRRVAEAANGTGEAQGALKELGLDAQKLARLSPDEQFRMVADAMENVSSQSQRVRLAFKLFDSEGVSLVNTLRGGSEQLEAFRDEARKLGLALTSGQIKQIEKAADAQGKVSMAFRGLTQQLAANFAPAMKFAADKTVNFLSSITNSIPGLTAYAARILDIKRNIDGLNLSGISAEIEQLDVAILGKQGEIYNRAKSLSERLGQVFNFDMSGGMATAVSSAMAQFGDSPELQMLKFELEELEKRYYDAIAARAKLRKGEPLSIDSDAPDFEKITPTAEQLQRLGDAKALFNEASMALTDFNAEQDRIASAGKSIFDQTRTDLERYVASVQTAEAALDKGLLEGGLDTFQRYRRLLKDQLIPDLESIGESTKKVTDSMSVYAEQAARNMQDAFADFLFSPFEDGLRGMLKSFLDTMRRIMANKIAKQLFESDGVKGFFKIFGLEAGGPVTSGTPYIVGEAGPELFVPGASGAIIPNNRLQPAGVSVVNNYSFAAGADVATIRREIIPMLERTKEATKAEMMQMRSEGRA